MVSCSQPRCCATAVSTKMLCHAIQGVLQFSAKIFCTSKQQASLSTTTSTPPLSLCNSTPVALHLHPCRSATPPLSLCNPEGGPTVVFGMLHGHTSSSCILSTFAITATTAADGKWLRWPWRSFTPQCFNLICV